MERERCVGCRSAQGPVCSECSGLTVGEVVTSRWRWPPFVAIAVAVILCGVAVLTWRSLMMARLHPASGVVFVPFLLAWAFRRMKEPHRLTLVGDRLELTSFLSGTKRLPVAQFESDKGSIVHVPTHTRIRVGTARYDGADRFHRALRVRRAARGLEPA